MLQGFPHSGAAMGRRPHVEEFPVLWGPPHRPVLPPEFAVTGASRAADLLGY